MAYSGLGRFSALIIVAVSFNLVTARKALGGSGGLHTRGAPKPKTSEPNDPTTLANIGNGWQLSPIDSSNLIHKLGKDNRDVAQYISDTLSKGPLSIQLRKKAVGIKASSFTTQEKYRAQVSVGSNFKPNSRSKLRSVWFIGSERALSQSSAVSAQNDLLTKSYEDNCSKLYPSHFVLEVFLPKTRACKGGNPLVTYSIPFGPGTTSPKSKVSQANGIVTVYPNGRKRKQSGGSTSDEAIEIGRTALHLNSGSSLVDPGWAKGRMNFKKGRNVGQL